MAELLWKTTNEMKEDEIKLLKSQKVNELREACNEAITSFNYIIGDKEYTFSYELDNQQNFSDTTLLFDEGLIDSVGWNAYINDEKVSLTLSEEQFRAVNLHGITHKTNCRNHYNAELMPKLEKATTEEDLNNIVWQPKLNNWTL